MSMHALIVEDSSTTRLLLSTVLQQHGYQVTAASTAIAALEALQRQRFPLIVLDWQLPDMDGMALCRQIRALPDGERSVILLTTAHEGPEVLAMALAAGADDYLPKSAGLSQVPLRLAVATWQAVDRAQRLRQNREFFDAMIETAGWLVVLSAPDGTVMQVNTAFEQASGYTRTELTGRAMADIAPVMPPLRTIQTALATPGSAVALSVEHAMTRRDGSRRHIVWSIVAHGTGAYVISTGIDMTELRDAEERQQVTEELLGAILEHSPIGIAASDTSSRIVIANAALGTLLGYAPGELDAKTIGEITYPDDREASRLLIQDMLAGKRDAFAREKRYLHRDGHPVWAAIVAYILRHQKDEDTRLVAMIQDITERKRFEEQLRHQAFHDALTGLPNRALLLDRLEQTIARAERYAASTAVLFLDLDRFKSINDSLGHDAGDTLLIAMAERLSTSMREEDTVARFGGDEFAVLLGEPANAEEAVRLAERIIRALTLPFRLSDHDVIVGTSIGIATGRAGHSSAAILRDAEVALYRAKARGRGHYQIFDEAMNAHALERLELETDLRMALARGEFRVFYQPKVVLGAGRLAGMEALVRWQSPTRGFIAPADFIPLAEETGIIHALGQWVLAEACRQTRAWNEAVGDETPLIVSINLSARQFAQPSLVDDVARALANSRVDPRHVQLEITESVAMGDAEATIDTLKRLKALEVQVAIDDFGTGFSSLAYLKRFPVDVLKIDRSFVSGMQRESEDAAIVNAVVGLGHALGLSVVAEGVETAEEARHLHEIGCDLGQGFHFARPLSPEEAGAFVAEQRQRDTSPPR